MTRVNTDILGISELKWTAVGEFSSDDHYLNYYGQKSLGRNGVVLIVNKRVPNAVHFSSLIPKMSVFTLVISYVITSNLP